VHTGDVRVDVQAAVAMLAPAFGFGFRRGGSK